MVVIDSSLSNTYFERVRTVMENLEKSWDLKKWLFPGMEKPLEK